VVVVVVRTAAELEAEQVVRTAAEQVERIAAEREAEQVVECTAAVVAGQVVERTAALVRPAEQVRPVELEVDPLVVCLSPLNYPTFPASTRLVAVVMHRYSVLLLQELFEVQLLVVGTVLRLAHRAVLRTVAAAEEHLVLRIVVELSAVVQQQLAAAAVSEVHQVRR
jgi:hypothetical protein